MLYGLNEANNPRLFEACFVTGAAGEAFKVNLNRPVTLIVCSVKQGAVDIYFGSPNGRLVPNFHFGQTNRPEAIPYTGAPLEVYCVAAGAGNTLAVVYFGGP